MTAPIHRTPAMQSSATFKAWETTRDFLRPNAVRVLGRAVSSTVPVAMAILQGCASAPPIAEQRIEKPAERKIDQTIKPTTPITPQIQAAFDSAMALLKAEQYEKSIDAFKKLAIALPDNPIPPTNLALVYKKLGKLDLAETHLKQALEIEPENPVASNELALLYRKTGRFAEARPIYERVLKKYPNFNIVHKNLGVLCDLYLKDYECALSHYRIYSLSAPDDKSVPIWIADVQKRSGK